MCERAVLDRLDDSWQNDWYQIKNREIGCPRSGNEAGDGIQSEHPRDNLIGVDQASLGW